MSDAARWTIIGPANGKGEQALVDHRGCITPLPGGPALDFALQPDGGPLLTATTQPPGGVRQRMQGRLPVVATAWEWRTLRLATEAYVCTLDEGPDAPTYVAVQAVVFNLSDDAARGHFAFTVTPHTATGPTLIRHLAYRDGAFVVNGRLFGVCLPQPRAWDCSAGGSDTPPTVGGHSPLLPAITRSLAHDRAGGCYGRAVYAYHIAPWEEAEFLAFLPLRGVRGLGSGVRRRSALIRRQAAGGGRWVLVAEAENAERRTQNAERVPYRLLKGRTTAVWTARLRAGMQMRLPDDRLEESWAVNKGHLLTLAGAGSGDPAVRAALAACGYAPANQQAAYPWPEKIRATALDEWAGRIAGAAQQVRCRDAGAGAAVQTLVAAAGPTFTWPTPPSPPGCRAYQRAVAHWLLLLRDLVLFVDGEQLVLLAGLAPGWLTRSGAVEVVDAPTPWGHLSLRAAWPDRGDSLHLDLTTATPPPGGYAVWLPRPLVRAELDGVPLARAANAATSPATLVLPAAAQSLRVYW